MHVVESGYTNIFFKHRYLALKKSYRIKMYMLKWRSTKCSTKTLCALVYLFWGWIEFSFNFDAVVFNRDAFYHLKKFLAPTKAWEYKVLSSQNTNMINCFSSFSSCYWIVGTSYMYTEHSHHKPWIHIFK